MKIICSKADLLRGVNIVSKAVSNKSTMTNLQCILIEASLSDVKLIANDIELGIETIITGEVKEPGRILLDAKLLSEIIRKLPDSEVLIETNANKVEHAIEEAALKCAEKSEYIVEPEKIENVEEPVNIRRRRAR